MKKNKLLIVLLVLLAIIVLCGAAAGFGYYKYQKTYDAIGEEIIPDDTIFVAETELSPAEARWRVTVYDGFFGKVLGIAGLPTDKTVDAIYELAEIDLGELGEAPYALTAQYRSRNALYTAYLTKDNTEMMLSGEDVLSADDEIALMLEAGTYSLRIESLTDFEKFGGTLTYRCSFSIKDPPPPPPTLVPGKLELEQGEILSFKLLNIPEDITPTISTGLGMAVWAKAGERDWFAAIPIGPAREPGTYNVKISAGEIEYDGTVTVLAYDFDFQDLTVNYGSANVAEATTATALQQYREKIPPLWKTYDEERYWSGKFIRPVEGGYVGTEFGEHRITNGDPSTMRYHYGMDIEVDTGTPIHAPNAGRVVLAEMLLNTGGTVVIEYGGGLKSYFFHMSQIDVTAGDMVAQGDVVGLVGNLGYSTGPHLHYEMRIGDQAVSPSMLFDDGAGLYSADK
ncbi:MAG: M23 family metallopeptidase [Clostridiales Family XIII bacterium]|jgi:murein DD-endopeptidase MepM/ murein hydrolase activator NlpD|nr:M23 family metallopeptidase [Clostridiales Family XIII bacterium]